MNKYNGPLSQWRTSIISAKEHEKQRTNGKLCLVYSICGMMAYASLWDDSEEGTISMCT